MIMRDRLNNCHSTPNMSLIVTFPLEKPPFGSWKFEFNISIRLHT